MKVKVFTLFVLTAAIVSTVTLSGLPRQNARKPAAKRVKLLGGILIPGNRLRWDIAWVDQSTARPDLGEAGNAGVDVFDAENDLYLGRIGFTRSNGGSAVVTSNTLTVPCASVAQSR
jgi:hypothetical protein